jgi:3-oxoacyl-[acyl-carrier-protein] synthase-3
MKFYNTLITGIGSHIPKIVMKNSDFLQHEFYTEDGQSIDASNEEIISKFVNITGIEERRYAHPSMVTSDLATSAAEKAIADAGIDRETIDLIIVAHNFGDVTLGSKQPDILPSIASRVKHNLKIKSSNAVAYDVLFGCPGWVHGVIQSHAYFRAGMAKRALVIGAETLSRVVDKHDRDAMIFADGAGAAIIDYVEEDFKRGILATATASDTYDEAYYLYYGKSNKKDSDHHNYIKMLGRKIYEYALVNVPKAMKTALDKSGVEIDQIKKVIIHQANEKMDEAIVSRFYRQYKMQMPAEIMPMNIQTLGNSSVATIPTLYDGIKQGVYDQHQISEGDVYLFASVGAGMNINAFVYKH